MHIFQNLDDLKIMLLFKILKSNSYELMDKNYYEGKKYTDEQSTLLHETYFKLFDEFSVNRKDKRGLFLMQKNFKLIQMSLMFEILYDIERRIILLMQIDLDLLDLFVETRRREIIKDFSRLYPKVQINLFSDLSEILTVVQQVIKSQTNIFDEKSGVKEKQIAKQEQTIHYIVSRMSKNLGVALDVNSMSCNEFIAWEEVILESNAKDVKPN